MVVCICLEELWILDLMSILVHSVAAVLDPRVCATIHVFYAFTCRLCMIPHHLSLRFKMSIVGA